ncbi:Serine/threonine-protein kinase Nek1 [Taenia crassiceps]|uniref:non-specific serine/threonine protein kinase n=1 Tax=Taenia crassiceps TaxID=6207 RepID=A0ABR4QS06_9CEST
MDQYEKIRKIGEGAFGIAWLASSKKSKSLKVVKEIGISGMKPKEIEESRKEYSNDLRNLIARLFQRNPRERPGITAILKYPIVNNRIHHFLTTAEKKTENKNGARRIQNCPARIPSLAVPNGTVQGRKSPCLAGRPVVSRCKKSPSPNHVLKRTSKDRLMRKRDLLVALHQKRQKAIAKHYKKMLMEKPKKDAFVHAVPVLRSSKWSHRDSNSWISVTKPTFASPANASKAGQLELVAVDTLSRYQKYFAALDEFKRRVREDGDNVLSSGDNHQMFDASPDRESDGSSGDTIPLAIVGKPVARVYPHVQKTNDSVERSYLAQDYLERRLAAAKNRAKSDNRSHGVAYALGHCPNYDKESLMSPDEGVSDSKRKVENGHSKVHDNMLLEGPKIHFESKDMCGRPPDGIPTLSFVFEQLKAASPPLLTSEAPSSKDHRSYRNAKEPKQRLIQKKKEIILRRINSRSAESDTSKLPSCTNGSVKSPVVDHLVNPVGRDRKTWNKSPITALLKQLGSADLDASRKMSPNGEAWIKVVESDVSAPQEVIRMDRTLVSVPNQGAILTSCRYEHETMDESTKPLLGPSATYSDLSCHLDGLRGRNLWLRAFLSADSIYLPHLWNTRPSVCSPPCADVTRRRASSLQTICKSSPKVIEIGRRFSIDTIQPLSLSALMKNFAIPSLSYSASTTTCSVTESLASDMQQAFGQTTAKPLELFDSKKYSTKDPHNLTLQRSQSQPSVSSRKEDFTPATTLATAVYSSWYSLFEETNGTVSHLESSEISEDLWEDDRDPVRFVSPPLQQQASTVTDSGFTTTRETPQSLHQTPTPVPSDTERTLTFHSVLLQLLETEGEEHEDFAEDSTLLPESVDEKPPSRFFIAEQIRMALEKVLELDTLIKCYNVVQNLQESEDDELHIGREAIASMVGQSRASEVFDRVLQLVLADGSYIDDYQ